MTSTDNHENSVIPNPKTPIDWLQQPTADRRHRLIPQVLADEKNIAIGKTEYQQYQQAIAEPNSADNTSVIRQFNHRFSSSSGQIHFHQFPKVNSPWIYDNKTDTEILQAYDTLQNNEAYAIEAIAQGYGIYTAAIEANDTTTAIKCLQTHPDLIYQPDVCQKLEAVVATRLSDIPSFLNAIAQENSHDTLHLGKLADIRHLDSALNDDRPPAESQASLQRILDLVSVSQAYSTQIEINNDPSSSGIKSDQDYQQFIGNICGQIPGDIPDLRQKTRRYLQSVDYSGPCIRSENNASKISQFMSTELFIQLPVDIQHQIQLKLLGQSMALTEDIVSFPSLNDSNGAFRRLRIKQLTDFISPLISTDTLTTSSRTTTLDNLDNRLISSTVNRLKTKLPKLGEDFANDLQTIARSKATEAKQQAEAAQAKAIADEEAVKTAALQAEAESKAATAKAIAEHQHQVIAQLGLTDSPSNPLPDDVKQIQDAIVSRQKEIIEQTPESSKGRIFKKVGYSHKVIDYLQSKLKALSPTQDTNDDRLERETERRALSLALTYIQAHKV